MRRCWDCGREVGAGKPVKTDPLLAGARYVKRKLGMSKKGTVSNTFLLLSLLDSSSLKQFRVKDSKIDRLIEHFQTLIKAFHGRIPVADRFSDHVQANVILLVNSSDVAGLSYRIPLFRSIDMLEANVSPDNRRISLQHGQRLKLFAQLGPNFRHTSVADTRPSPGSTKSFTAAKRRFPSITIQSSGPLRLPISGS